MSAPGIYVETRIRGPIDEVWRLTQTPDVHQRWDLRFTEIEYLPRPDAAEPQRFLYATRIGFGVAIRGTGESVGQRTLEGGEATSALRFASKDPKSLIRKGSGYWRYVPTADGVRFFTWYEYEVRFGTVGRAVDRAVFRPLMGWATAWSFDRLRRWVEEGQTPESSLRIALGYALARGTVAFIWIWHGLVPKLLAHDAGELRMMAEAGARGVLLPWVGVAEIVFGLSILLLWRQRSLLVVNAVLMIAALVEVVLRSPEFVTAAFNPVTLNVGTIALSAVAWVVAPLVPSAGYCRRTAREESAA